VVAARPALGVALAGARLASGETAGVADLLDEADRRLADLEESADLDTATRQALGWVEVYRSALARARHDTDGTLLNARTALDRLDPGDDIGRAAASALLGLASWEHGDLDEAHDAYAASQTNFETAGFLTDVLGCAVVLADIRKSQGRLHDALAAHIEALSSVTGRLASKTHLTTTLVHDHASAVNSLRGIVDTYIGMADIHRERGDLDEAARLLHVAETAGDRAGLPQARYCSHVVAAQLQQARGDLAAADALLGTAKRLYVDDFHPDVAPVAATRARVWVRQGRIDDALTWARSRNLTLLDDVAFLRYYEHLTLVRAELAALAQGRTPAKGPGTRARLEELLALLERLLHAATAGGCYGTVVDALIQQAVALRLSTSSGGLKRSDASLQSLERALSVAEPEGYARVFLDEGPAVLTFLDEAARAGMHPDYVHRLLAAGPVSRADAGARAGAGEPVVVESLSPRELDVLRLLASELNGPDIARELVLSLNTIRTHTKNIYGKLGVTNRRAAVRRAHELNLLRGPTTR
jgi:LuxR family maltose regulon positive regulatory protein